MSRLIELKKLYKEHEELDEKVNKFEDTLTCEDLIEALTNHPQAVSKISASKWVEDNEININIEFKTELL